MRTFQASAITATTHRTILRMPQAARRSPTSLLSGRATVTARTRRLPLSITRSATAKFFPCLDIPTGRFISFTLAKKRTSFPSPANTRLWFMPTTVVKDMAPTAVSLSTVATTVRRKRALSASVQILSRKTLSPLLFAQKKNLKPPALRNQAIPTPMFSRSNTCIYSCGKVKTKFVILMILNYGLTNMPTSPSTRKPRTTAWQKTSKHFFQTLIEVCVRGLCFPSFRFRVMAIDLSVGQR